MGRLSPFLSRDQKAGFTIRQDAGLALKVILDSPRTIWGVERNRDSSSKEDSEEAMEEIDRCRQHDRYGFLG